MPGTRPRSTTAGTAATATVVRPVTCTSTKPAVCNKPRSSPAHIRAGARSQLDQDLLATLQPRILGGDHSATPVGVGHPDDGPRPGNSAGLDERPPSGSATCWSTAHMKMASKLPSGNGRRWMSLRTRGIGAGPGSRSRPTTIPLGPDDDGRSRRSPTPVRSRDRPVGRRDADAQRRTRQPTRPSGAPAPVDAVPAGTARTKPARSPAHHRRSSKGPLEVRREPAISATS